MRESEAAFSRLLEESRGASSSISTLLLSASSDFVSLLTYFWRNLAASSGGISCPLILKTSTKGIFEIQEGSFPLSSM